MYTRPFSDGNTQDIPSGYHGNAFSQADPSPAEEAPAAEETMARPMPHKKRREDSLFSRLSLSRLGELNLGSIFSSDLLLIAVALLIAMGDSDGCEEEDNDLWILLLLLYFMK